MGGRGRTCTSFRQPRTLVDLIPCPRPLTSWWTTHDPTSFPQFQNFFIVRTELPPTPDDPETGYTGVYLRVGDHIGSDLNQSDSHATWDNVFGRDSFPQDSRYGSSATTSSGSSVPYPSIHQTDPRNGNHPRYLHRPP